MLYIIHRFIGWCYGDLRQLPTVEEWALHNANKATPDGIIAECIVASFARDYDTWKLHEKPESSTSYSYDHSEMAMRRYKQVEEHRTAWTNKFSPGNSFANCCLVNEDKDIKFSWRLTRNCDKRDNFSINGIPIPDNAGKFIWQSFDKLTQQIAQAKATAAKAEREMKENEAKWNLAEKLLGMKRNEFGALVPKEGVECSQ